MGTRWTVSSRTPRPGTLRGGGGCWSVTCLMVSDAGAAGVRPYGDRVSSISSGPGQTPPLAVKAIDLSKDYGSGEARVTALRQVNVGFPAGIYSAIMGPSGSGKSTLMHCLAGLDSVTSGSILIGDIEVSGLSDRQLTLFRRD